MTKTIFYKVQRDDYEIYFRVRDGRAEQYSEIRGWIQNSFFEPEWGKEISAEEVEANGIPVIW